MAMISGKIPLGAVVTGTVSKAQSVVKTELVFGTRAEFPENGNSQYLYIAQDENVCYRFDKETGEYVSLGGNDDVDVDLSDYYKKDETDALLDKKLSEESVSAVALSGDYNDLENAPSELPASDVHEWAKAESKPVYTAEEVGADTKGVAENALETAKTYADGKADETLETAKTYADGKADETLSQAKTYADGKADETLETAKTYADGKADETLETAKTYADNKADEALNAAKTHTDTRVAELINSAPTTLDTLGEIAAAMTENKDVVEALDEAIGTKANAAELSAHTGDRANPHGVTKEQIGLGNAENKSAAEILGELSGEDVKTALGYTPSKEHAHNYAASESEGGAALRAVADENGENIAGNFSSIKSTIGDIQTVLATVVEVTEEDV